MQRPTAQRKHSVSWDLQVEVHETVDQQTGHQRCQICAVATLRDKRIKLTACWRYGATHWRLCAEEIRAKIVRIVSVAGFQYCCGFEGICIQVGSQPLGAIGATYHKNART